MSGRLAPGPTGAGAQRSPLRRPPDRRRLEGVYRALLRMHGPQQWWPRGEAGVAGDFEICAGAILTQNTAWRNAASALQNLRAAGALAPEPLAAMPQDVLASLVRPSGHFNVKARKLKAFAATLLEEHGGSLASLFEGDGEAVRERLLAIWGVGPETADAMLLYAARRPAFVVDAYVYRLMERLDMAPGERRYDVYRGFFMARVGPDVQRLNEWHALIVRHGQGLCRRSTPLCAECTLVRRCPYGAAELGLAGGRA